MKNEKQKNGSLSSVEKISVGLKEIYQEKQRLQQEKEVEMESVRKTPLDYVIEFKKKDQFENKLTFGELVSCLSEESLKQQTIQDVTLPQIYLNQFAKQNYEMAKTKYELLNEALDLLQQPVEPLVENAELDMDAIAEKASTDLKDWKEKHTFEVRLHG